MLAGAGMNDSRHFRYVMLLPVVAACLGPAYAAADVVSPPAAVTITQSYAYAGYGGGDFVFSTKGAAPGCGSGWYIKATDPGYKTAVAVVLTAQAAGLQVIVYGDNSDLWTGSPSGQYCRLQTVGLSS
jgi:hypothetical protein